MTGPEQALAAVHDRLWDPAAAMVLVPAGVNPRVDLSALRLLSTRETVLGAFADLESGRTGRAVAALEAVLRLQYRTPGRPWDGTFRVTAQEPEPGDGAVEWFHYDPNWRQFIGTLLALVAVLHAPALPAGTSERIAAAVRRCAEGEPPDRIAPWYTNPRLLHAWLGAHVGRTQGVDLLLARGERLALDAVGRVERLGDVDEYNSPTYDGIDLLAAALWVAVPPTPAFADGGRRLLEVLTSRLSALYHPGLAAVCGPYARAYGCDLTGHVALVALWLHTCAGADRVLPAHLDERTDHVHDLFFLPVVRRLAELAQVTIPVRPVGAERRHVQRFGDVAATSLLWPRGCAGFEHGRRPDSSADQYVPLVVHAATAGGPTRSTALMFGDRTVGVDVERLAPASLRAAVSGPGGRTDLRVVTSAPPTLRAGGVVADGVEVRWGGAVSAIPVAGPPWEVHLEGPAAGFTVDVDLGDLPDPGVRVTGPSGSGSPAPRPCPPPGGSASATPRAADPP